MYWDLKTKKLSPIKANAKKNNLALRIIPESNKFEARFGISGSFIKFNQLFEKKNAIETPNKIKILNI